MQYSKMHVIASFYFLQLIREYVSNADAAKVVNRYDRIFFLPVVNPDGYVFSWTVVRLFN